MWLVLCDRLDGAALWAADALRARGLQPLEVVTADDVALAELHEHRLVGRSATLRLSTERGARIDGARLRGVLNRLYTVPIPHWRRASEADRDYVQQEAIALALSWLHALPCTVVNRPTPQGLCGQWRPESEWAWLARRAGLPVRPYRQTSRDGIDELRGERRLVRSGEALLPAFVVGGQFVAPAMPAELAPGCLRLARLAGTQLLGIEFVRGEDGWRFAGANPMPLLNAGGAPLVEALVAELGRGEHQDRRAAA